MSETAARIAQLSPRQRELLLRRLGKRSGSVEQAAPARIPRRPRTAGEPNRFPVSFSQLREWILDRIEPGSSAYNIPGAMRASGPLSIPVLEAAVEEVVRRHEALRTTFEAVGGEPVQVVAAGLRLPVPLVDLQALPQPRREVESLRLSQATVREPFDLARGPLLRLRLLRLGPVEHLFVFALHHIVADGWSIGVFMRELAALYAAFSAGLPSPLPELPVQYGDFAAWQREALRGERFEAQLDYWRRQLADLPPLLRLPTDRPRPPVQTFRGARQPVHLSPQETAGLRSLAAGEGTSLFVALLAAFQALLGSWSGEGDLAVGTFSGSRGRAEIEGLIGFFVNTLVLRADLSGDPSLRELIRRQREVVLSAFAHGEIPFEKLLESLRVERSLSHTPLFQVMLVLQNFPAASVQPAEVKLSPVTLQDDRSNFDLSLWFLEGPEGLGGSLEHNVDLFDAATVRRMAGHFEALVRAALDHPDVPLSRLAWLAPSERHQVLVEWNDTAALAAPPPPVHRLFAATAARTPEAPALLSEAGVWTYGELAERAGSLAGRLRAAGIGPESIVGVFLDRSFELIAALLAVLEAGAAYLPLDPDYPAERLGFMLADSGTAAVLTRRELLPSLPGGHVPPLLVDDFDADSAAAGGGWTGPEPDPDPGHPAYVIYTSGSTGLPKGVVVRHGALARYVETARLAYGLGPEDRVLQFASIGFDTSAEEIFPCLAAGAALVLRSDPRPEEAPEFFARSGRLGVTVLDLPTAYWHELVAALERDAGLELPGALRLVILGGERAQSARVRAWLDRTGNLEELGEHRIRLVNTYGPTEGTIVCTHADLPGGAWDARMLTEVPIGRPVQDARVYLLDRGLRPVPLGAYGELCVGGAALARGYAGRPELTAERFVPDPWGANGSTAAGARLYRTGDLARYRPDGRLEFGGRVDDQLKVRGVRVEPGEVEAVLSQHPAVREAVAGARPDPAGGLRLIAWVAPQPGESPTVGDLRGFLRDRVPEAMVPSAFVLLPELPRLPNGKLDRRALPEPGGERPELEAAYVPPESELERTIAAVWQELLQVDRVGLNDNFFELGGHSLLLVQAQGRLCEALGREIAVVDLFRFPTVSLLARHLGGEPGGHTALRKAQNLAQKQRAAIGRQAMAKAAQERLKKK